MPHTHKLIFKKPFPPFNFFSKKLALIQTHTNDTSFQFAIRRNQFSFLFYEPTEIIFLKIEK